VPVNKLFNNYTIISDYLQTTHGLSLENATALGDSKMYENPQVSNHSISILKLNLQEIHVF
jgi:hypothetical protein